MTLNVIAYQWGWDYFVPLDILSDGFDETNYVSIQRSQKYNSNFFLDLFKNSTTGENLNKNTTPVGNVLPLVNYVTCDYFTFFTLPSNNVFKSDTSLHFYLNSDTYSNILKSYFCGNLGLSYKLLYPTNLKDLDEDFFKNKDSYEFISTRTILDDSFGKRDKNSVNIVDHRYVINSGVVLPTNTPIHIICGSKDVIHS